MTHGHRTLLHTYPTPKVGAPWDDGSGTTGARLFGRDADFAEHFLNSDGPRAARVAPRQPCRAAVNGAGGVWRSSCV